MATENNQYWRNKVIHFCAKSYDTLTQMLNKFYEEHFVIATQIFPEGKVDDFFVDAIVYYKVPPESSK